MSDVIYTYSRRGSYREGGGEWSLSVDKSIMEAPQLRDQLFWSAALVSCSFSSEWGESLLPDHTIEWSHIRICGGIFQPPEVGGFGPQCSDACWLNTPTCSVHVYKWTNLVVCALPRSSSLHTCLATASGPQDKLPFSGERFAPYLPNTSVNGNNVESKFDVYIQWPQVGVLSK